LPHFSHFMRSDMVIRAFCFLLIRLSIGATARPWPPHPGVSRTAAAGGRYGLAGTDILGFFSLNIKMHTMA
jgi:hypothetical protein